MADEVAQVEYEGQITENGTVSVFGRGKCTVSLSGGFGAGTASINQDVDGSWVPLTDGGTDVSATTDNDWTLDFPDHAFNGIQVSLAGATAPTLGVKVSFDGEPPLQ